MRRRSTNSWRWSVVGAAALCAVLSAEVAGQSVVLAAGDSARLQVAPGSRVRIPLVLDFAEGAGANLASLSTGLTWDVSRLTLDSIRGVGTTGFSLTTNTANAGSGSAAISVFGVTGVATTGPIVHAFFTAGAVTGGSRLLVTPTAAGSETGMNLLPFLRPRALGVCVAPEGRWGDVNDDGATNIIDAQQIARFTVGLSVANAAALVARADVTADGSTNIIDAQQIARFTVGLSAAARINESLYPVAPVASLDVTPNAPSSVVVGTTLMLTPNPRDATGASLAGCVPVTYTSSAPAVATVAANGLVTTITTGTATITATAGGRSTAVSVAVTSPVASVSVNTAGVYANPGDTLTLVAVARDSAGVPVPSSVVSWSSSNASVASVGATGRVTALSEGTASITATSMGRSTSVPITVGIPRNGLLAWYPFNGNANDESGNGRHGTVTNAVLTTDRTGSANRAYSFNGSSTWIASQAAFFNNGMTDYTVAIWFRPNAALPRRSFGGGAGYTIWSLDPHNSQSLGYLHPNCPTDLCWFKGNSTGGWIYWEGLPIPSSGLGGNWHHILVRVAGTNHRFYLNGVLVLEQNATGVPPSAPFTLLLGTAFRVSDGEVFAGALDDMAVWNRALSADEIAFMARR